MRFGERRGGLTPLAGAFPKVIAGIVEVVGRVVFIIGGVY